MSRVSVRAVLFGEASPAEAVGSTAGWRSIVDGLGAAMSAVSPGGRRLAEREVG